MNTTPFTEKLSVASLLLLCFLAKRNSDFTLRDVHRCIEPHLTGDTDPKKNMQELRRISSCILSMVKKGYIETAGRCGSTQIFSLRTSGKNLSEKAFLEYIKTGNLSLLREVIGEIIKEDDVMQADCLYDFFVLTHPNSDVRAVKVSKKNGQLDSWLMFDGEVPVPINAGAALVYLLNHERLYTSKIRDNFLKTVSLRKMAGLPVNNLWPDKVRLEDAFVLWFFNGLHGVSAKEVSDELKEHLGKDLDVYQNTTPVHGVPEFVRSRVRKLTELGFLRVTDSAKKRSKNYLPTAEGKIILTLLFGTTLTRPYGKTSALLSATIKYMLTLYRTYHPNMKRTLSYFYHGVYLLESYGEPAFKDGVSRSAVYNVPSSPDLNSSNNGIMKSRFVESLFDGQWMYRTTDDKNNWKAIFNPESELTISGYVTYIKETEKGR